MRLILFLVVFLSALLSTTMSCAASQAEAWSTLSSECKDMYILGYTTARVELCVQLEDSGIILGNHEENCPYYTKLYKIPTSAITALINEVYTKEKYKNLPVPLVVHMAALSCAGKVNSYFFYVGLDIATEMFQKKNSK